MTGGFDPNNGPQVAAISGGMWKSELEADIDRDYEHDEEKTIDEAHYVFSLKDFERMHNHSAHSLFSHKKGPGQSSYKSEAIA